MFCIFLFFFYCVHSMRPSTPRLRINSEDFIDRENGPPCLKISSLSSSNFNQNQNAQSSELESIVASSTTDVSVL